MSFVTYSDVITGLTNVFTGIADLPKLNGSGAVINILNYEPNVIHTTPTLYMMFHKAERNTKGQVTTMRYHILCRLVLEWQVNQQSELALMPFLHTIPAAVDADPSLGGRVDMGLAMIDVIESGFVLISDTLYRNVDFYANVPTKAAFRSGI